MQAKKIITILMNNAGAKSSALSDLYIVMIIFDYCTMQVAIKMIV